MMARYFKYYDEHDGEEEPTYVEIKAPNLGYSNEFRFGKIELPLENY